MGRACEFSPASAVKERASEEKDEVAVEREPCQPQASEYSHFLLAETLLIKHERTSLLNDG